MYKVVQLVPNPLKPNSDQKQTSTVKLWAVKGSADF